MTVLLAAGSIFDPIYNLLGGVLAFFYGLVPNLGLAIILLTVSIMVILYPLTAKQARSMIAMQRVQPEMKKLQAKYKNDRQKLNEEMMAFYKENKINPLAGCLPLVVQLPIFFALFRVLHDSYKHIPKTSELFTALCGGVKNCTADSVHHLHFLGNALDLQKAATDSHAGLISALPYFALVALVMLTGFLQTHQAQKRTPQANKQMGTVMKVLPVFFGVISLQFPAGLVLYFFVSNSFRVGQQELIFRRHGSALMPAGKGTVDVKSRERPAPRRAEPVPEAEIVEEAPPERSVKSAPEPRGNAEPASPARAKGGLRGLFQLPPPPEGNGGGRAPVVPKRPVAPSRPPQPRANTKKKRKR